MATSGRAGRGTRQGGERVERAGGGGERAAGGDEERGPLLQGRAIAVSGACSCKHTDKARIPLQEQVESCVRSRGAEELVNELQLGLEGLSEG